MALRGFYPSSRSLFVPCAPAEACQGGVNSSVLLVSDSVAGCGPNYSGLRCAECRSGSYRRGGRCHTCPNTAWLLFLSFAFAIVAVVGAAVYLSRKRVNLAGLSVGVVRAWLCVAVVVVGSVAVVVVVAVAAFTVCAAQRTRLNSHVRVRVGVVGRGESTCG